MKHKFKAQATERDGIRFDSKLEARCYDQLKLRQKAGEVVFFLRQVPLDLPGGAKLRIDFLVFESSGDVRFVDAKGFETARFKLKRRIAESIYPIEIELWKG